MEPIVDSFVTAVELLVPCLKDDPQSLAKRAALTKEEKVNACDRIATCASQLIAQRYNDMQKLMEIAVETLFAICNDTDSAVRLVADEALNRLIRSCLTHHQTRIYYELFKEIKRNGHSRSVRAALTKFADCARFIRAPKTRAYLINLVPALAKLWQRDDDMLHECIATFLERVAPCLLPHGTDADVLSLLKAILPNLHADSVVTRRTAATCLRAVCESAREPLAYLSWTMNVLVDMLLPVDETKDPSTVVGALQSVRALLPPFALHVASKPWAETARPADSSKPNVDETSEATVEQARLSELGKLSALESATACGEQMKQVLQILVHLVRSSRDSNILVAALEAFSAFLAEPALSRRLLLEKGAVQPSLVLARDIQRENRERRRVARLSITSLKQAPFESPGVSPAHRGVHSHTHSLPQSQLASASGQSAGGQLRAARSRSPSSYSTSSASASIGDDVFAGGGGGARPQLGDAEPEPDADSTTGHIADSAEDAGIQHDAIKTSATLHSLSEQVHSSRADEKPTRDDDEDCDRVAQSTDDDSTAKSDRDRLEKASPSVSTSSASASDNTALIGSFMEEAAAEAGSLVYVARLLAVRFLLDGQCGRLLVAPATVVRVSHRSLALQCVAKLLTYRADLLQHALFRDASSGTQLLADLLIYIDHDDPLLRAQTCELLGAVLRHAVTRPAGRLPCAALSADRVLQSISAVLQPTSTCAQSKRAAVAALSAAFPAVLDYAIALTGHEEAPLELNDEQCAFLEQLFGVVHQLFDRLLLDCELYWLVRLELIDLLRQIDFGALFFCLWSVQQRVWLVGHLNRREVRVPHWKSLRDVLFNRIFPMMLADEDARIRNAACDCLLVVVPDLTNLSADFQPDLLAHERALRTRFRLSACSMQHSVQQYTVGLYPTLARLSSSPPTRSADERQLENVSYFVKWLQVACLHRAEQKFFVQSALQLMADLSDRYAFVDSLLSDKHCLSLVRFLVDLLANANLSLDLRVQNSLIRALGNLLEQTAQRCMDDAVRNVLSGTSSATSQGTSTDPKLSPTGTQSAAAMLLSFADREWSLLGENKELVRCLHAALRHVHFIVSSYCAVLDGTPPRHAPTDTQTTGAKDKEKEKEKEKDKEMEASVRVSQAAEAIAAKLPAIVSNASPFRMRKLFTAVTSVAAGEKPTPLLQSFSLSGSTSQNSPSAQSPASTTTSATPISFHTIYYQRLAELVRTVYGSERASADFERTDRFWTLLRSAIYTLTQLLEFCTLNDLLRLHLLDELAANFRTLARVEPAHVFACLQAAFRAIFLVNRVGRAIKTKPASPVSPTKHAHTPRRLSAVSAQTHLFDEAFSDDTVSAEAVANAADLSTLLGISCAPHALTRLLVTEVIEKSQFDYIATCRENVQPSLARAQSTLLLVTQRVFRFSPLEPTCTKTVHRDAPALIRKFERLVLDSLTICPFSHHVEAQNAILNVLIQLVQLRINYTMLDVDLSLFSFVLKQAELLGDAEITAQFDVTMQQRAALLIPTLFTFLLLLAFDSSTKQPVKALATTTPTPATTTASGGTQQQSGTGSSKGGEQKSSSEVRKEGEHAGQAKSETGESGRPAAATASATASQPSAGNSQLITSEKVIQLCDTLMAGTLSVEAHVLPALACIVNELFIARIMLSQHAAGGNPPASASAAQLETFAMYDTQREYLVAILIRIMNRHTLLSSISAKIFTVLSVILCGWRRVSEAQHAKCSEQLWYMGVLPLLERAVNSDGTASASTNTKRADASADGDAEVPRLCTSDYLHTLFRFVSCLSTKNVSSESLVRLLDAALKRLQTCHRDALPQCKLRESCVVITTVLWHLLVHAKRSEALARDEELLANCIVSNFSVVDSFAALFDDSKLAEFRRERLAAMSADVQSSGQQAAPTVSAVYILTRLLFGYAAVLLNDVRSRQWFETLLHVQLALYRLYTLSGVYQCFSRAAAELFAPNSVRGAQLLAELGFVFAHLSDHYPAAYLQFVACFSNFPHAPLPTDDRLITLRLAHPAITADVRDRDREQRLAQTRRAGRKEFRLQILLEALSHRLFLVSNVGAAQLQVPVQANGETQFSALLGDALTFVAEKRVIALTLSSTACFSYHQCLSYFCDILLTLNTTSKAKSLISVAMLARLAHFLVEQVLGEIVDDGPLLRNVSARKEIYKAALCVLKQVLHNLAESSLSQVDRVAVGERLKTRFLELTRSRAFWKTTDIVEVESDIMDRALAQFERPKDDADDSVFDAPAQTGLRSLDRADYTSLVHKLAVRAGVDNMPTFSSHAISSMLFGLSRSELTQLLDDPSLSPSVFSRLFEFVRLNIEEVRFMLPYLVTLPPSQSSNLPPNLTQLVVVFDVSQKCFLTRLRALPDRQQTTVDYENACALLGASARFLEVKQLVERENRRVVDESNVKGVRRVFSELHRLLLTEVDSSTDIADFSCTLIESLLAASARTSQSSPRLRVSDLHDTLTTIYLLLVLGDVELFNDENSSKRFIRCVVQVVGASASLFDDGRVRWPPACVDVSELDSYFVQLVDCLVLSSEKSRQSRSRLPRSLTRLMRSVLVALTKNVSHLNVLAKLPSGNSIEPVGEQQPLKSDDVESGDSPSDVAGDKSDRLRIRTASSTSLASTSSVANLYTTLLEQLHDRFPVLEAFQQRLAAFGWRKKFEFEEIWMCLLSVLNPPPKIGDEAAAMSRSGDAVEDERAQTQAAVWTIRCINQLLLRTRQHRAATLKTPRGRLRTDPFAATPLLGMLVQRIDEIIAAKWLDGIGLRTGQCEFELQHGTTLNLAWTGSPEYTMSVSGEAYDVTYSSLSDLLEQIGLLPAALSSRAAATQDAAQSGEPVSAASVDTRSCVQFLLELFQQWLALQTASNGQPTIGQPSALVKECVRSLLCLSEFFVEASQFDKMVQILLDVRAFYVAEDELTSQYVLVGLGKALCVLALARASGVDNSLGKEWAAPLEKLYQVLIGPLRRFVTIGANLFGLSCNEAVLSPTTLANSPILFNAECLTLMHTLLYLFECWSLMNQTNTSGVTVVAEYWTYNEFFTETANGSNMLTILELTVQLFERVWFNQVAFQTATHTLTERHLNALLALGFYMVEHFQNVLEIKFPTFAPRFLQQALNLVNLNTAQLMNMTAAYWSAGTLWQSSCVIIVRGLHRLMLRGQLAPQSLYEVVIGKLTGDWLRSPANELFSLLCVQFVISWLYLGVLGEQPSSSAAQSKLVPVSPSSPSSLSSQLTASLSNKESMHLLIERMCTLFSRMKRAHSFETVTIARLLETLILRCYVPSNDFLNKIMSEFLGVLNMEPSFSKSSKQSLQHPRNLEAVTRSFATLVFSIFQRALVQPGDEQERTLVHTWIRLTLTNFLQLSSLAKSFWSISNLLLGATASSSPNVGAIRNGLFSYCVTMMLHCRPLKAVRGPPLSLTQLFGDAIAQYAAQLRSTAKQDDSNGNGNGNGYVAFHRALHSALQARATDRSKSTLSRESTGGSVTADESASASAMFSNGVSSWSRYDERALHQFLVQVLNELPPTQQSS